MKDEPAGGRSSAILKPSRSFRECTPVSSHHEAASVRRGYVAGEAHARFDTDQSDVGGAGQLTVGIHPGIRIDDVRQEDHGKSFAQRSVRSNPFCREENVPCNGRIRRSWFRAQGNEREKSPRRIRRRIDGRRSSSQCALAIRLFPRRCMYCRIRNLLQYDGAGPEFYIRPLAYPKFQFGKHHYDHPFCLPRTKGTLR